VLRLLCVLLLVDWLGGHSQGLLLHLEGPEPGWKTFCLQQQQQPQQHGQEQQQSDLLIVGSLQAVMVLPTAADCTHRDCLRYMQPVMISTAKLQLNCNKTHMHTHTHI
jgi:hypothetical protein